MRSRYSCSEDSDASNSYFKSTFRVSVCLKRYFQDVRARCYILVRQNRRVRWLERRIQKVFALRGSFFLCVNGHLLPSTEPLAILSPEDNVEVIPQLKEIIKKQDGMDMAITNENSVAELRNNDHVNLPTASNTDCSMSFNVAVSEGDNINGAINLDENASKNNKIISTDDIDCAGESQSAALSRSNTTLTDSNTENTALNSQDELQINLNNVYENHTLQHLKRHALALLDSQSTAPRRKRIRVRRRTGRTAQPSLFIADSGSSQNISTLVKTPTTSSNTTILPASSPIDTAEPAFDADSSLPVVAYRIDCFTEKCTSPQQEIARNEAISSRKPRMVRSIDLEV